MGDKVAFGPEIAAAPLKASFCRVPRNRPKPSRSRSILRTFSGRTTLGLVSPRVGCALILALTVAVILIARDQQESMRVEIGEEPVRGNLPAIIDKRRRIQVEGELGEIRVFKSTIEPFSQRIALKTEKSHANERPTTCVFELIKLAWLFGSEFRRWSRDPSSRRFSTGRRVLRGTPNQRTGPRARQGQQLLRHY